MDADVPSDTARRGPFFSLVVPAYGSARYLSELFNSLDAQTFRDFEVLFAVEKSPDDSLKLCQQYATRHTNVRVASLPCTGAAGASRNWCYSQASGTYLVPVDGDDWIDADALARLAEVIRARGNPEVVVVTARVWLEAEDGSRKPGGVLSNLPASADGEVFSGCELLRRIGRTGRHAQNYAALTVVRADFLRAHDLRQRVGVSSEDSEWVPRTWLSASRMTFLAKPYYNYRRRNGSVSNVASPKILYSVAVLFVSLARFYETLQLPPDVRRYVENDAVSILCWYLMNGLYRRRFTNRDRMNALQMVLAGSDAARFRRVLKSASFLKRVGLRLLILCSALRVVWPALVYFRWFYYPLTCLKHRR